MAAKTLDIRNEADRDRLLSALGNIGFSWSVADSVGNIAVVSEALTNDTGALPPVVAGLNNTFLTDPIRFELTGEQDEPRILLRLPSDLDSKLVDRLAEELRLFRPACAINGILSLEKVEQRQAQHQNLSHNLDVLRMQLSQFNADKADRGALQEVLETVTDQEFHVRGEQLHGPTAYFDGEQEAKAYAAGLNRLLGLKDKHALSVQSTSQGEYACALNIHAPDDACLGLVKNTVAHGEKIADMLGAIRDYPKTVAFALNPPHKPFAHRLRPDDRRPTLVMKPPSRGA